MTNPRPITIAGGGLAGLALGIALRVRKVPVTIHEASTYPRHRVCGEFLNGVTAGTLRELGIDDLLSGAHRHRTTRWFRRGREIFRAELPRPALGLSRFLIDDLLQRRFTEQGGELQTRSRQQPEPREGLVWAAGRRLEKAGRWVGLKCHASNLEVSGDLEMHLGDGAYVGMTPIEGGKVNICGLFPADGLPTGAKRCALLLATLHGRGLGALADKLAAAQCDDTSFVGTAGFELGGQRPVPGLCTLGDSEAIIPPFTGNGMSMAFEAAESALEPLTAYAYGKLSWEDARGQIDSRLVRRFSTRLRTARLIHPLFLNPLGQRALAGIARTQLLPFRFIHSLLS